MRPDANGSVLTASAPVTDQKPSALEATGGRVAPKPVDVTSVPQTPVNNSTPAGGSPRPELEIAPEPAPEKAKTPEAPVILGRADEKPYSDAADKEATDKAEAPSALQDDSATTAAGEKRKLDDGTAPTTAVAPPSTNGNAATDKEEMEEIEAERRPEKKTKVTEKIADKVAEVKDKLTGGSNDKEKGNDNDDAAALATKNNNGNGNGATNGNGAKKPGRPRKDKTAPPAVGRAQRKTRSQGPV